MIEGFMIGLGIVGAIAALWLAGWGFVLLMAFIFNQRERAQREDL